MKVIVTGGAGYIGSHTVVELISAGHEPVVLDNFSNSRPEVFDRLKEITGRAVRWHKVDVTDEVAVRGIFEQERPEAVIHFAGLKAVGESVARPLDYYHNNLVAVLAVSRVMQESGVRQLVFSSSATVYGDPETVPIAEDAPLSATNPYGWTKLMGEQILRDVALADPSWRTTILRYFNPVGAHESGLIGEDPLGLPNNIMPMIAQVAAGRRERLSVFGDDYGTPDGTGVRDYIHVVDLAKAHVLAIEHSRKINGINTYNLGSGRGYSVLELVKAFEAASGQPVPYEISPRRPGDVAACYADPALAKRKLGWATAKTLEEMCADVWRWQSKNPDGYALGSGVGGDRAL